MLNKKQSILVVPVIIISFIIASMLNVYPLSASMAGYRPLVLMMVLLFWVLHQPKYVSVFIAFLVGLIADLLLDTRLGQQGLCAVIMLMVLRFMLMSLRQSLPDMQLTFMVTWVLSSISLIVFQMTLWMLQFTMQDVFILESIKGLILSIVGWPLVYIVFYKLRDVVEYY